jgi:hypothetical protein
LINILRNIYKVSILYNQRIKLISVDIGDEIGDEKSNQDEIDTYLKMVSSNFKNEGFLVFDDTIEGFDVIVAKITKYKWEWIESLLNIFSIIGASEKITQENIEMYSKISRNFAQEQYKGLSTEAQTGIVSFALLASFDIEEDAIDWVQNRPDKYFPAFEMPVISDLKNNELYYYEKVPQWGGLYYRFLREFVKDHF